MSDPTDLARIGGAVIAPLEERNARAKASGRMLKDELARILRLHPAGARITAKQALRLIDLDKIGRYTLPSERTVQLHLQKLRKELKRNAVGVAVSDHS